MRAKRLPAGFLAFGLPGLLLLGAIVLFFAKGGDLMDEPARYTMPLPPCFEAADCLDPSPELAAMFDDEDACEPEDTVTPRVCLVPLGAVRPALVWRLIDYYEEQPGLDLRVLPPVAIPEQFVLRHRPQYSGDWLFGAVASAYPEEAANPAVNLIVLTPVDLWLEDWSHWNWAFGKLFAGGNGGFKNAIVSHYRMDDRSWGWFYDSALFESRVRKMLNKYIAILYYRVPFSPDSTSATYRTIRSVYDLDRMEEHIPLP